VTVIGTPLAVVRLEGGGTSLEFGPVVAGRKVKKLKKQPVRTFTIENIGCTPLILTFESLKRTGIDVERGIISDPDDRHLFHLTVVDATGDETPLEILTDVRINPGQKQVFRVRFTPVIPAVANATRGLSADQVLPDLINSVITFNQNGGEDLEIKLVGHVDTKLILIDPENPRRAPVVVLSRVEDDFLFEYSIYDSNRDVTKATYQFFDKQLRPAGQPVTVDLAALIEQIVKGQSVTIAQRFTGAKDHPEIFGVMITVFDGETSESVNSASKAGSGALRVLRERDFMETTLFAPVLTLSGGKPRAY
jgi:hypothetical protein